MQQGKRVGLGNLVHGANRESKPYHPDRARWTIALCGCAVLLAWLWGPSLVTLAAELHPEAGRFRETYARYFHLVYTTIRWVAWGWVALTGAGIVWAAVRFCFWHRYQVPRLRGTYYAVVLPRPQGGRQSPHTAPDGPHVFWDRLLRLISLPSRRNHRPYLALELWGDASGRVAWGMWIPEHLADQYMPLRRLITADRPQARLVMAPDPLDVALDTSRGKPDNPGTRWYASATLTLMTHDCYPLLADPLALPSTVAALRPARDVYASGVSLVVAPVPRRWTRRIDHLVRHRQWISRYDRRSDQRWKEETDEISIKAQGTHARTCLRVQVIASSRGAAERECRAILATLTSSRKRYRNGREQGWTVRRRARGRAYVGALPAAVRHRAPVPVLSRVLPIFPLV